LDQKFVEKFFLKTCTKKNGLYSLFLLRNNRLRCRCTFRNARVRAKNIWITNYMLLIVIEIRNTTPGAKKTRAHMDWKSQYLNMSRYMRKYMEWWKFGMKCQKDRFRKDKNRFERHCIKWWERQFVSNINF
jgi:hypothetical protein